MIKLLTFIFKNGYIIGLLMIVASIALSQIHWAFLIGVIFGVMLIGLRGALSLINIK